MIIVKFISNCGVYEVLGRSNNGKLFFGAKKNKKDGNHYKWIPCSKAIERTKNQRTKLNLELNAKV